MAFSCLHSMELDVFFACKENSQFHARCCIHRGVCNNAVCQRCVYEAGVLGPHWLQWRQRLWVYNIGLNCCSSLARLTSFLFFEDFTGKGGGLGHSFSPSSCKEITFHCGRVCILFTNNKLVWSESGVSMSD